MRMLRVFVVVLFVQALAACNPVSPTTIPPAPPVALRIFTDPASQFSTSDLRDAQDQIVQFNTANELVWTADGTRLPGFPLTGGYISAEKACACSFEIRFGIKDGERRAYVTADYGHYNPGSVVDLEIVAGTLVVTETHVFPPGTFTLSGFVTEATAASPRPVASAGVSRAYGSGHQYAVTDARGSYAISGLFDGTQQVYITKEGFRPISRDVAVSSDTRFDIELVRQP